MITPHEHAEGGSAAPGGADAGHDGVIDALRAIVASLVEAVSQWLVLAELEARDAVLRVLLALAMAIAAVILVAAAWLFAVSAGAAALIAGGVSPVAALVLVAVSNLLLGGAALWVLWLNLRDPWFRATRRQLRLSVAPLERSGDAAVTH